jgi:hypothetical protein
MPLYARIVDDEREWEALSGHLVQSSVCPVLGMGHPDRSVSVASA